MGGFRFLPILDLRFIIFFIRDSRWEGRALSPNGTKGTNRANGTYARPRNMRYLGFVFGPPLLAAQPCFHSSTNSFQSATSCGLRMKAMAGSSFGARGAFRSFKPAS